MEPRTYHIEDEAGSFLAGSSSQTFTRLEESAATYNKLYDAIQVAMKVRDATGKQLFIHDRQREGLWKLEPRKTRTIIINE